MHLSYAHVARVNRAKATPCGWTLPSSVILRIMAVSNLFSKLDVKISANFGSLNVVSLYATVASDSYSQFPPTDTVRNELSLEKRI